MGTFELENNLKILKKFNEKNFHNFTTIFVYSEYVYGVFVNWQPRKSRMALETQAKTEVYKLGVKA